MRSPTVVTSALTAVLALALVAAVPAPAFAAAPPSISSIPPSEDGRSGYSVWEEEDAARTADVQAAAVASVSGEVDFRYDDGTTGPAENVTISMWRLNPDTGWYDPIDVPSDAVTGGSFTVGLPEAGDYAIQFIADPTTGFGSEYYDDARYFFERTDISVLAGQSISLGTVELAPRFFDGFRLAGPDRFATAVEITRQIIPDDARAPVVYIANGYKFPDALAAGPAATLGGGVFLPTAPDYLPQIVADELKRLNPLRIVIAGDANSVSESVRLAIAQAVGSGTEVVRLGGATRYETAALIVQDAFAATGSRYAIVATGANFPDALSAGPAAGRMGAPVLLVDGAGRLDDGTRALLDGLGVERVLVAGGPTTVSPALEADLVAALGADNVVRRAGVDRYQTAGLINDWVFGTADFSVIANGYGFIDALAGGPLAGALGAPLYLASTDCMPYPTLDGLLVHQVSGFAVLGSQATLTDRVLDLAPC